MKNIVITGAAKGIGYYLVHQLLDYGYQVTVLDINIDNLNDLAEKYPSLMAMVCDVRDREHVNACVKKSVLHFGSVDCAVHNACKCTFKSMAATNTDTFHDVFDVNYFGALHLAQAVLPHMQRQKNGRVIFTSSGVGIMGFINISPYASSKGAIESLAKCLNIEYQPDGISFHIFHPPLTRTESSEPLPVPKELMADPKNVGKGLARHIQKKSFIICHSLGQKAQTTLCYLFPIAMGKLMSKLTASYIAEKAAEEA